MSTHDIHISILKEEIERLKRQKRFEEEVVSSAKKWQEEHPTRNLDILVSCSVERGYNNWVRNFQNGRFYPNPLEFNPFRNIKK